ncbi:MAG: histidine kinase [Clostridiales bacterium]|jgi:two-component system sensor histidine kinase YesM|nr:histidine kinase [Clostridiales bacterium]
MKAKKQRTKGFSLRRTLLIIVTICWLLPMILTLVPLAYYTNQSVRRNFDESVRTAISGAAVNSRRGLTQAVADSRAASYDGRIRAAYINYVESGNRRLFYKNVKDYLDDKYRYNDYFLTTMIFLAADTSNIYYTFNTMEGATYTSVVEYERNVHETVTELSKTLDTKIGFVNVNGNVYMVRNIVSSDFEPYAVIVSQLNLEIFVGSFGNIIWEKSAVVYFNNTAINVMPAAQPYNIRPENLYPGEQTITEDGALVIVSGREYTDSVDIRYNVEVDLNTFLNVFYDYDDILYLLLILTLPLLVIMIWFFYGNIFKPIDKLVSALAEIQGGKLGATAEGGIQNREFNYLRDSFNSMSVQIKEQFDHIYNEELALRDARIMALQSQINPHFLNNTLEIINWEVRLGNNERVTKMLEALSTMLDAAMDRKSSPLVTLEQEMKYVDAYLYIISERFGKRLSIKKDMQSDLMGFKVPRLIMQPVIENAVEHGTGKLNRCKIEISAEKTEHGLSLKVKNNKPMTAEEQETAQKLLAPSYGFKGDGSLHLGIHNVNQRLKIIFGEDSSLNIHNEGEYTVAVIFIPDKEN